MPRRRPWRAGRGPRRVFQRPDRVGLTRVCQRRRRPRRPTRGRRRGARRAAGGGARVARRCSRPPVSPLDAGGWWLPVFAARQCACGPLAAREAQRPGCRPGRWSRSRSSSRCRSRPGGGGRVRTCGDYLCGAIGSGPCAAPGLGVAAWQRKKECRVGRGRQARSRGPGGAVQRPGRGSPERKRHSLWMAIASRGDGFPLERVSRAGGGFRGRVRRCRSGRGARHESRGG